ncbi:hypothetical protein SKB0120_24550 (plasmid) [Moraxella osloensis]
MNNILILYPKEFNSYTKFQRKVSKIVSNLDASSRFTAPHDSNQLIHNFIENNKSYLLQLQENWDIAGLTHAIVFDDGTVFNQEIELIRNHNIPLRIITIQITRVVNIKTDPIYKDNRGKSSEYEYIGRGSYWGNPYSMFEDGDEREEVIRKFKYDFDFDKFPKKKKSEVYKLAGKTLGCFCKPESCHGDVLADFLNAWDDGN